MGEHWHCSTLQPLMQSCPADAGEHRHGSRIRGFEFVGERFSADGSPASANDAKLIHDALPEPRQCVESP